ncbi:hypothetical protein GCK32_004934 [Trichostrongylus colubriformis]|uniref:Uncharacterized protein n=1 Tax=Trichostrongylus colubriformis TaxID=6319 RepID=A0AAN8IFP9_TRICO
MGLLSPRKGNQVIASQAQRHKMDVEKSSKSTPIQFTRKKLILGCFFIGERISHFVVGKEQQAGILSNVICEEYVTRQCAEQE